MKNKTLLIIGVSLVAAFALPFSASAAGKKKAAAPATSPEAAASASPAKAPRPYPFHGTASAVDQNAKTFTIAGKTSRVFKVTDKTAVTKGGKTASMSDITDKVEVGGSYWKNADGSLEAKMVKIGAIKEAKKTKEKPEASPTASPKKS